MDAIGSAAICRLFIYPKGAPEKAGLYRQSPGGRISDQTPSGSPRSRTKSMGSVDAITRAVEHQQKIGPARPASASRRLPADGCGLGARRRLAGSELRTRRSCSNGCAQQDRRPNSPSSRRPRSWSRFHAGGYRQTRPGHDQARIVRGAAIAEEPTRHHFRILPAGLRRQPQPRALAAAWEKATCCLSTSAAIITAISATSRGWRCWASRTAS